MVSASAPAERSSHQRFSIGQVLARLEPDFPGVTSSKLRFLEVQGIVTPERTASGYRKFSMHDISRLRLALSLQRDQYLPLNVIREHLDTLSDDELDTDSLPVRFSSQTKQYRREELLAAAGAAPQLLNEAIVLGMITASDSYSAQTLSLLQALVALERHGIEPRHLRGLRQSAEREVALVEAAMSALLRRTDAASRARAADMAPELYRRLDDVRTVFAQNALNRLI